MLGITATFTLEMKLQKSTAIVQPLLHLLPDVHASFSLPFLSSFLPSLLSSSLSFSLVNNFNQIFRKVFPVPLKNSSVSLTSTKRVGEKNKPQAAHC